MIDFQKMLYRPVPYEMLLSLHEMGFKLVPLDIDGKPALPWTPIFEKGWDVDAMRRNQRKFTNVGTCFGYVPHKQLYLNCLDIDSDEVFYAVRDMPNPMSEKPDDYSVLLSCSDNTYMTKTRKEFGYHIYWLSGVQNPPVRPEMTGQLFEIKTDKSGGTTTLPPSLHRVDHSFQYQPMGAPRIAKNDRLYGVFMDVLKQFLKKDEPKNTPKKKRQGRGQHSQAEWEEAFRRVPEWQLGDADAEELLRILQPVYESGSRNQMMMGLGGMFRKFNVTEESAGRIMRWLLDQLGDKEWQGRMWNLKNTYRKDRETERIAGYRLISDNNQYAAKAIMKLMVKRSGLFGGEDEVEEGGDSAPEVQQPPV